MSDRNGLRLLKCSAGGQSFCLDVESVAAIERGERMAPNPQASGPADPVPSGWIARKGGRVPVYRLADRLGIEAPPAPPAAVLVIRAAAPWALAVDRIARFSGAASGPQPLPPAAADPRSGVFRGVLEEGESLVLYVAPERLHPEAKPLPVFDQAPSPRHAVSGTRAVASPARLLVYPAPNAARRVAFGISFTQILEIVPGAEIVRVPPSPVHLLGLVRWRQRAIAVVDAGALLGLPPLAGRRAGRLLVARSGADSAIALPVDGDLETHSLPLPHRRCQGPAWESPYARGAFEIPGGRTLILPDLGAAASPNSAGNWRKSP